MRELEWASGAHAANHQKMMVDGMMNMKVQMNNDKIMALEKDIEVRKTYFDKMKTELNDKIALLESEKSEYCVKMHNLKRDIRIACEALKAPQISSSEEDENLEK